MTICTIVLLLSTYQTNATLAIKKRTVQTPDCPLQPGHRELHSATTYQEYQANMGNNPANMGNNLPMDNTLWFLRATTQQRSSDVMSICNTWSINILE